MTLHMHAHAAGPVRRWQWRRRLGEMRPPPEVTSYHDRLATGATVPSCKFVGCTKQAHYAMHVNQSIMQLAVAHAPNLPAPFAKQTLQTHTCPCNRFRPPMAVAAATRRDTAAGGPR